MTTRRLALVQALTHVLEIDFETETLKTVAVFCSAGLLVSLIFAAYGLDMSSGPS